MCVYVVCVCVYIFMYIYVYTYTHHPAPFFFLSLQPTHQIHTHTHTHTHTSRYLVPADLSVGQFTYVIRKRIRLPPEKAIFIFVNNYIPPTCKHIDNIYVCIHTYVYR
jgi:hypothetical protein